MPIRIKPDGVIEADTVQEFEQALRIADLAHRLKSSGQEERNASNVQEFVEVFPLIWHSLGEKPQQVLTRLFEDSNGLTDVDLNNLLGYPIEQNYRLAGTMQAIGKVAKRHGYQYVDVISRRPVGVDQGSDSAPKYRYELTARARSAVATVLELDS